MKVIYPYRKTQSRELEWSIKSLKNIKHDGICIVGDEPPYEVDAEYIMHLPGEYSSSPHHDQAVKYLLACSKIDDDELLLMNDDFFIMKQWDPQNYNKGILSQQIESRKNDAYTQALRNTEDFLMNSGYGTFNFEMHTPMLVNRQMLQDAIDEILPRMHSKTPILVRSYYGNKYGLMTPFSEDVKNPAHYKDATLLSTTDSSFLGEIGGYIRKALV